MDEEKTETSKITINSMRDSNITTEVATRTPVSRTESTNLEEPSQNNPRVVGGYFLRLYKRLTYSDLINESTWSINDLSVASEVGSFQQQNLENRGIWTKRIEFLLSCIGYAVGLGNVWRFPFKVLEGGGGAFFIPYFIMLLTTALPILLLEMGIGQFSSKGPVLVWNLCPLFRGVGYSTVVICIMVGGYYNVILAWSLLYIGYLFKTEMPWADCKNDWNDNLCIAPSQNWPNNKTIKWQMAADQFWERKVLGRMSKDNKIMTMEDGLGALEWSQVLALFLSWVIIGGAMIKGPKSSGKAAYIATLGPYALIFIFIGIGTGLQGSGNGLKYLFYPDFSKVLDIQTWRIATEQIFYSLGIGFGSFTSLASYNEFTTNIYRDTFVISAINSFTSIYAGISVFQMIGFIAHRTNKTVEELTDNLTSHGLVFVAYAEGLSHATGNKFFTFFFFALLILLGLGSQIGSLETVITALKDEFPYLIQTEKRKMAATVIVSIALFFLCLFMMAQRGIYYLNMVDSTSASYSLMMVSIFELIAVVYFYGLNKFVNDIYMMLHLNVGWYWKICWSIVAPSAIFIIFIWSATDQPGLSYGLAEREYIYPEWANVIGWVICVTSFIAIPVYAVFYIIKIKRENPEKTITEILKLSILETNEWGPALQTNWLLSKRYRDKMRAVKTGMNEPIVPSVIE